MRQFTQKYLEELLVEEVDQNETIIFCEQDGDHTIHKVQKINNNEYVIYSKSNTWSDQFAESFDLNLTVKMLKNCKDYYCN